MTTEESTSWNPCKEKTPHVTNNAAAGAVYGLGLIGAAIYFIGHAATFWAGVLGFLKAIIWPVFMVIKAFEFLQ
ncbi:MAG: hypothetical protein V2A67_01215 [Bacteroidota bacterium]